VLLADLGQLGHCPRLKQSLIALGSSSTPRTAWHTSMDSAAPAPAHRDRPGSSTGSTQTSLRSQSTSRTPHARPPRRIVGRPSSRDESELGSTVPMSRWPQRTASSGSVRNSDVTSMKLRRPYSLAGLPHRDDAGVFDEQLALEHPLQDRPG
jgi:hypothetical protein